MRHREQGREELRADLFVGAHARQVPAWCRVCRQAPVGDVGVSGEVASQSEVGSLVATGLAKPE